MDELYTYTERKKQNLRDNTSEQRKATHTSLKNKSQTYTVEGVNSDLRHYIPPLHRKSKCFFRSIETAKAVFKIFIFAFNKFALAKFLHPSGIAKNKQI